MLGNQINLFKVKSIFDFDTNSFIYKGQHYDHKGRLILIPKVKKLVHKSYALGFNISRELIEDDLYGDIFNMKGINKRKNLEVTVTYEIKISDYQVVTLSNGIFNIPSQQLNAKDLPMYIKSLKKLATYNKKQPVKKVVRRKRRKNGKRNNL